MAKKQVPTQGAPQLTHSPFAALLPGGAPIAAPPPPVEAPSDETSDEASPSFPAKVVVRREKKGRGGKTVTRIQGLPAAHREALMDRLKRALGCGASIDEEDVLLHGALVDRAADWLEGQGAKRVSRSP